MHQISRYPIAGIDQGIIPFHPSLGNPLASTFQVIRRWRNWVNGPNPAGCLLGSSGSISGKLTWSIYILKKYSLKPKAPV
ncbi:MAG TPA: hypothetical protein VNE41_10905 [Chitinophagaceae bacterium]|nr:hypothetical protein [Chitinophagaceae bacterium]